MKIINKIFKLTENNTDIKTEIIAGFTTFFTMSYLYILVPKILETTGLEFSSTLAVTVIIVFIGSILMGIVANKPYAVAPFLGEVAFISFTLVAGLGFSIKTIFAAIALCGILLFIMTITNIRENLIKQIPENIKISFCSGLGLFFIFIALKDIGIVKFTTNNIPLQIGNFSNVSVILGILCYILIIVLSQKGIKAAIIISIISTTIVGLLLGDIELPNKIISLPTNINFPIFQTNFAGLFNKDFFAMFVVVFLLINIDTAGGIIGLSYKMPNKVQSHKKEMIVDSISVILAPLLGTTPPGAYLDSMTGITAGGRTGLTAITIGLLFLTGLIFTPIIEIIPAYAYAPALLYVGTLLAAMITKINFEDITEYAPAMLTISIMIFTYNIGVGIISAFITYPIIKLLCGRKNETNITIWIMLAISIIFFFLYPY